MGSSDMREQPDRIVAKSIILKAVQEHSKATTKSRPYTWVYVGLMWLIFLGDSLSYWFYWGSKSYFPGSKELWIFIKVTLNLVVFLTLVWVHMRVREISKNEPVKVRNRLETSGLAEQLAGGHFCVDQIYQSAPWFLRRFIVKVNPKEFREVLNHVTFHLNWYTDKPKRYNPTIMSEISNFGFILWTIPIIVLFVNLNYVFVAYFYVFSLFPLVPAFMYYSGEWTSVYRKELASYLLDRLES